MSSNEVSHRVRFGPYEADLRTHELRKHGTRLKLSGQPFQILEVMLSRPGDLITRDELREKLWPEDTFVDFSHGLNAAVNKLRDALNDSADNPKYIETLPRRGYRFIGQVEPSGSPPASTKLTTAVPEPLEPPPSSPASNAEIASAETSTNASSEPHRSSRWRVAALAFASLIFLACLLLLLLHRSQQQARKLADEGANHEEQTRETSYILQIALGSDPDRHAIQPGPGRVESPQLSPDGKRLAFMSNRSGQMEIWVSNADGSNPVQLTDRGAGSPRWSPDGKLIAFDGRLGSQGAIFVTPSTGGLARTLVREDHENLVPSFSHDGRWVYFASDASGDFQVWKISIDGGTPVQITKHGGFAAQEGPDGDVFYADTRYPNPKILRVPAHGGAEQPVLPHIVPSDWASWAVAPNGIYFVEEVPQAGVVLSFYDFAQHDIRRVASLDHAPFWLSISPDGHSLLMDQPAR